MKSDATVSLGICVNIHDRDVVVASHSHYDEQPVTGAVRDSDWIENGQHRHSVLSATSGRQNKGQSEYLGGWQSLDDVCQ